MKRGKFITLEGIDGAGKSTHLDPIRAWLQSRNIDVVVTREPGGTPLGEALRAVLLHQAMNPDTEALLMSAARAEHVQSVIKPALERGAWVLSDRFADASFAYQGGGRGVSDDHLRYLEDWVTQGIRPDLTLLFDLNPEEAQRRVLQATLNRDRFEREHAEFFARVRAAYLARAAAEPRRIHILDSSQPPARVFSEIETRLSALCT
jgi:dTMP kinase